jgi:hypothetical protein
MILILSPAAEGQDAAVVRPTGEIPKKNYKTWSLFLVCNPAWLTPDKNKDLLSLYQQFQEFGRTIGTDQLAVWFWNAPGYYGDPNLAAKVDVERSVRFCKAFNLKPSESPQIVVTSTYPDLAHPPKEFAAFRLADMSAADISGLLAKLSDQLLLTGTVTPPPAAPGAPAATAAAQAPAADAQGHLWIRLLSAAQQAIGNFGCAWSLKINSGPLTAELHSCTKQ